MVAEASRERKAITTVTSFAPRQVVLLNRSMKQKSEAGAVENGSEAKERKSEKKRRKELRRMGPLLLSVAAFLDRKGLSATLSALQSEGSIEVDSWKTDPFNLEDMYSDFCTTREKLATATANDSKTQGSKKDETSKKDNEEKDHRIKRKVVVEEDAVTERISSMTEGEILKPDLNNGSCGMEEAASESKEEKKRKKKKSSEYRRDEIELTAADMGGLNNEDHLGDPSAKSKEKKKKNKFVLDFEKAEKDPNRGTLNDGKRLDSECPKSASNGMEQDGTILKSKEKKKRKEKSENDVDMKKSDENGVDVKNKEQKKRKRSESDKQDSLSDDHFVDKDKPVKKTDGFDDKKAIKKHELESQSHPTDGNSNPSKKRKAEKIEEDRENYDDANVDSKSAFQGGKEKPIVDCDVAKNGPAGPAPKTLKENSAEPRTAKAFSRVKLDEVEFVDDRLQDNSYWAKDGADTGYGAKAQEILGQVRGRDFRHEKTKKKRGSYRGGEIDLQSHSIKFNYSDDE